MLRASDDGSETQRGPAVLPIQYQSNMIPENKLLFACTRQNFTDFHQQAVVELCRDEKINWDAVYATAQLHGVAPLIYANLRQFEPEGLAIPPQIWEKFKRCSYGNVVQQERRAEALNKALLYFKGLGIDVMLIKGAALDLLVYDHPWYKIADDVDLVLKRRREDISDAGQAEIVQFLHATGIEFDYYHHHDVDLNGVLPIDFDRIWRDATETTIAEMPVFLMTPEDMLISVCTNSCRKRYFRLKCLCDVAEIVGKYDDLNWPELTRRAKEDDCNRIVYTALLASQLTVGCEVPDEVFQDLDVGPTRATAIRYVVRYVSRNVSLSKLYPYTGGRVFGRKVTPSLVLPYLTFHRDQLWRRFSRLRGDQTALP